MGDQGVNIRIFVSTDNGSPLSGIIRAATGGFFSHAGIRIDERTTFEARGNGDHVFLWKDEYEKPNMKTLQWSFVGLSNADALAAFAKCEDRWSGQRYGYGQLLSFGWNCLRLRMGMPSKMLARNLSVCSELVWRFIVNDVGRQWGEWLTTFAPDRDWFAPDDPAKLAGHQRGLRQWADAATKAGMLKREA